MRRSNYITNFVGAVSQHMEYFAFGETFVEEHKNSHNSPYKFNGKELDEESGYTYFGARYLDMRYSNWISVDPLTEKFPSWSPYVYCKNAPVTHIDPDGREALRWPPKDYWQAMHYGDLQHLSPTNPEKGFERMFARYYKANSLQSYSSSSQLTTRFGDVFKPDGKSKYPHGYVLLDGGGISVKYKDNVSLFEVTTAKKNVGSLSLGDKNGQLKAYIDYLYETPENRSVPGYRTFFDKQGRFNLVTLPEITDISQIEAYGVENKVDVRQYVPYYRLNDKGNVDIEFRQRKTNILGEQKDEQLPWKPIENTMPSNQIKKDKL